MSHPSAAAFLVTDLLLTASSVPWRTPATFSTLIHPTNKCVPVANPPPYLSCPQPVGTPDIQSRGLSALGNITCGYIMAACSPGCYTGTPGR